MHIPGRAGQPVRISGQFSKCSSVFDNIRCRRSWSPRRRVDIDELERRVKVRARPSNLGNVAAADRRPGRWLQTGSASPTRSHNQNRRLARALFDEPVRSSRQHNPAKNASAGGRLWRSIVEEPLVPIVGKLIFPRRGYPPSTQPFHRCGAALRRLPARVPRSADAIYPADLQRRSVARPDADLEIRVILSSQTVKLSSNSAAPTSEADTSAIRRRLSVGTDDIGLKLVDTGVPIEPRIERHRVGSRREIDVGAKDQRPGRCALRASHRAARYLGRVAEEKAALKEGAVARKDRPSDEISRVGAWPRSRPAGKPGPCQPVPRPGAQGCNLIRQGRLRRLALSRRRVCSSSASSARRSPRRASFAPAGLAPRAARLCCWRPTARCRVPAASRSRSASRAAIASGVAQHQHRDRR